ncbi:MAG: TerC family protein [Thermoplasmatota archaeon]
MAWDSLTSWITTYRFEPAHIGIFVSLVLLEAVLSLDNVAVLAALVRPLTPTERPRALLYGLVGAYVFRILAVLLFVGLLNNLYVRLLAGLYLVFLAGRYFVQTARARRRADAEGGRGAEGPAAAETPSALQGALPTLLGLSVFWATVIHVEITDAIFALDQILVAVAFTTVVLLVILAALTGILLLRVATTYVARLMDWFPLLESLAYVVVAFVGLKVLEEATIGIAIPNLVSIAVTLGVFAVPLVAKLLWDRTRPRNGRARGEDGNG